jgi:hypothetical protein
MAKNILEGYVSTSNNIEFTVQAVGASEHTIYVVFDSATQYQVVKLDVTDLPPQDGNKHINWINNFGVVDSSGHYVPNVNYTVFLPARANASFIYKDAGGLKTNKTPASKGSKPERPGMVQVDFSTGDPGIGWK